MALLENYLIQGDDFERSSSHFNAKVQEFFIVAFLN